jgi:hypothetical protein
MSPTLLEFTVLLVLIVVAWQLGLAIAPSIMRWLRGLKQDVDEASEEGLADRDHDPAHQHTKEHTNGTRH